MNTVTWLHPAPHCTIPITHPARAYVPADDTDVSKTWAQHAQHKLGDDYDRVTRDDWLEPGRFIK